MDLEGDEGNERPRRAAARVPAKASAAKAGPSSHGSAVSASCNFCKQRHIRCDGKSPCGQCVKRNLGCYYGVRAKTGPKPRTSADSTYSNLVEELRAHRRISDFWKNQYVAYSSQSSEPGVRVNVPPQRTPNSDSSEDDSPEPCALHDTYQRAKVYVQGVWSKATSTMAYLNSLDERGGTNAGCFIDKDWTSRTYIPVPKDHPDYDTLVTAGEEIAMDEEPSRYRILVALDLFESQVGPMVTDYRFKRCMTSALAIWRLTEGDTADMNGSELLCRYEHSIALMCAFAAMEDWRTYWRYQNQVEMLTGVVFIGREMHMMAQYAEKLAHLLIHIHAQYSGESRPGFSKSLAHFLYLLVSTHRPFVSNAIVHRMCMTMMSYASNHLDRVTWMQEALESELSGQLDEVWSFTNAFLIFFAFSELHPIMNFGSSTHYNLDGTPNINAEPSYSTEYMGRLLELIEFAASKLGKQDVHFSPLGHVFPDILLAFHLFMHGVRAEILLRHGQKETSLSVATFVIGAAAHLSSVTWNAAYGLQCAIEVCCALGKHDWALRACFYLTQHSIRTPVAWTLVLRNRQVHNLIVPSLLAQRLKRRHNRLIATRAQNLKSLSMASSQDPPSSSSSRKIDSQTSSAPKESSSSMDEEQKDEIPKSSLSSSPTEASFSKSSHPSSIDTKVEDKDASSCVSAQKSLEKISSETPSSSAAPSGMNIDVESSSHSQEAAEQEDDKESEEGDEDEGFDLGLPLTATWRQVVDATPALTTSIDTIDMKAFLQLESNVRESAVSDPLATSCSLSRAVTTGAYSSQLASSIGVNYLRDETFVPFSGLKPKNSSSDSEVDDEDVMALLCLLDNVKDDKLNNKDRQTLATKRETMASDFQNPRFQSHSSSRDDPSSFSSSSRMQHSSTSPDEQTLLSGFPHLARRNVDSSAHQHQQASSSVPQSHSTAPFTSKQHSSSSTHATHGAKQGPPPIVSLTPQSVLPTSLPHGFPVITPISTNVPGPQHAGAMNLGGSTSKSHIPPSSTPQPASLSSKRSVHDTAVMNTQLGPQRSASTPVMPMGMSSAPGTPQSASLEAQLAQTQQQQQQQQQQNILNSQMLLQAPYLVSPYAMSMAPTATSLGVGYDPVSMTPSQLALASQFAAAAAAASGGVTPQMILSPPHALQPYVNMSIASQMAPQMAPAPVSLHATNVPTPATTASFQNPLLAAHAGHHGTIDARSQPMPSLVPLPADWGLAYTQAMQQQQMTPQQQQQLHLQQHLHQIQQQSQHLQQLQQQQQQMQLEHQQQLQKEKQDQSKPK